VIAVEGIKTEPQYFSIFNNQKSVIWVNCLKGNHDSSPPQILKRMENYLKREALKSSDEAWLVVDKDQWTNDQLEQLNTWSTKKTIMGLPLAIPSLNIGYCCILKMERISLHHGIAQNA